VAVEYIEQVVKVETKVALTHHTALIELFVTNPIPTKERALNKVELNTRVAR
jgi:hypothetical protein